MARLLFMDPWVLVDDTSNTIVYNSSEGSAWTSITTTDNDGLHPPDEFIFQNTLHVGTGNVSLTYKFSGTAIEIGGRSRHLYADSAVRTKLACLIDGVPALIESETDSTLFSHDYCVANSLSPGEHTVQLSAIVNYNSTFLLDSLRYVPLEGANTDNLFIGYNQTDKSITYQGMWHRMVGVQIAAPMLGTTATIDFNGTSLQWISGAFSRFSRNELRLVYTIDDGPKHKFFIPNVQSSGVDYPSVYDRILFDTGPIPPGKHKLQVISDINAIHSGIPITLRYIIVQNITPGSGSPTSNLTAGSSPTNGDPQAAAVTASSPHWTGLSTVTIAGIAVGSAAVIMLVVVIVVIRTRPTARNSRNKPLEGKNLAPNPQGSEFSSRSTSSEHFDQFPVSPAARPQNTKSRTGSYLTGLTARSTMMSGSVKTRPPISRQSTSTHTNTIFRQSPQDQPSLPLSPQPSLNKNTEAGGGIWSLGALASIGRETALTEEPPLYSEI